MSDGNAKHAKELTDEQIRFVRWLALPKAERAPKTQRELAKDFGIDEATLSDWKHIPGFRDAVRDLAREYVKDDVPEVLATIRKKAIEGSQYHTNLFLAMAGMAPDVTAGNPPAVAVEIHDWRKEAAERRKQAEDTLGAFDDAGA